MEEQMELLSAKLRELAARGRELGDEAVAASFVQVALLLATNPAIRNLNAERVREWGREVVRLWGEVDLKASR